MSSHASAFLNMVLAPYHSSNCSLSSLGSGVRGKSVLTLSEELLSHFGTLSNLRKATIPDLLQIKGIGKAKAIQLKAIFELNAKEIKEPGSAKYRIRSHKDVYNLISHLFENQTKELLVIILRDTKGNAFHHEVIGMGTLSEVLVHPREVYSHAIRHSAHNIILAHNHPSGDPTLSKADIELTKLLQTTGKMLGIPLDDHLVIGSHSYESLIKNVF